MISPTLREACTSSPRSMINMRLISMTTTLIRRRQPGAVRDRRRRM